MYSQLSLACFCDEATKCWRDVVDGHNGRSGQDGQGRTVCVAGVVAIVWLGQYMRVA